MKYLFYYETQYRCECGAVEEHKYMKPKTPWKVKDPTPTEIASSWGKVAQLFQKAYERGRLSVPCCGHNCCCYVVSKQKKPTRQGRK